MQLLARVRYLCKQRNIPIKKLIEDLGVSKSQFYKYVGNNPRLNTIEKIAKAIGVQPSEILGDSDFYSIIHYKNKTYKIDTYNSFLELSKTIEKDYTDKKENYYVFSTNEGQTFIVDNLKDLKRIIEKIED